MEAGEGHETLECKKNSCKALTVVQRLCSNRSAISYRVSPAWSLTRQNRSSE
jgi:hypothetical protein